MEQSKSVATSINPFVLRQAPGCETSDFQSKLLPALSAREFRAQFA